MVKDSKIVLPKIPGRIYSASFVTKYGVFYLYPILIICFVMMVKFTDMPHDKLYFFIVISAIGWIVDYKKRFSVRFIDFVDVYETHVRVKYGDGKDIKDDLENCCLVLGFGLRTLSKGASKNYKYGVYLIRKNCEVQMCITLTHWILCPIKLKEWVESFQSQIAKPLPIVFSSPEVESDYNSGIYMLMKKSVKK